MKRILFFAVTGISLLGQYYAIAQELKLNPDNIDQIVAAMTDNEKVNMLTGQGVGWGNSDAKFPGNAGWTYAIPRLGIPAIYFGDGPQGINIDQYREYDATDYSCVHYMAGSTLASSWDVDAAYSIGAAIGYETRERGMDVVLGPAINIHRNLLGGRVQEYYTEDPFLNGKMAAAWIRGAQSEGVGTSLKHFAANNQETNRVRMDVRASVRALREIYLKGFEIAVKESDPWTVMSSYNYINGVHASENKELLTHLLREEWGYKGAVISDWGAVRIQADAINAGLDQIESGWDRDRKAILDGMADGTISRETVDAGVKRMLELVVKCPGFKDYVYSDDIHREAHRGLLRQVAAESMVLLKNEAKALPLNSGAKVALYGCTSYDFIPANMGVGGTNLGEYHITLVEGLRKAGFEVYKPLMRQYKGHVASEKARIERKFQKDNNVYYLERRPEELIPSDRAPRQRRSRQLEGDQAMVNWGGSQMGGGFVRLSLAVDENDLAVITFGRTTGEHADRKAREFSLTEKERELLETVSSAFHAARKQVIVLLNTPTAIETASWRDLADAILYVGQPGERAGESVADVLSGKVNPSGRLADTWEIAYGDAPADKNFPWNYVERRDSLPSPDAAPTFITPNVDFTCYDEGIYVGYRYFTTAQKPVAYPFGFGLSYTDFAYSNASVADEGDGFRVNVTVTNTGSVAGKEVVELYVSAPKGKLEKPAVELKGFAKTGELKPGESQTLTITVPAYDLASYDEKACAWTTDKGTYTLRISKDASTPVETLSWKATKRLSWKTQDILKPTEKIKELSVRR